MKTQTHDFFTHAQTLVDELAASGHFGTAQSYTKAAASLRSYLGGTTSVEEVSDAMISGYNAYLRSRGIIRNSISFYNRTLRAIYNKAVKRFQISDKRPFAGVYTGVDKTRNRAVSEVTIAKLLKLDLAADKSLELARDLFIFSYAMRGMAFVDMAYLRRSNVHGNFITYTRKKTGTCLQIRIEPPARAILDKYKCSNSEYLLPVLRKVADAGSDHMYKCYQAKLTIYNRLLKCLAQTLGVTTNLTSYVSRHSWATAARNSNIGMSVISESLGHSSERMTRIYLGTFDARLVDDANRKLLSKIKKFVSPRETNTSQRYI